MRLVVDADDSPHLGFPQTKAELYIACAEHDEYVPLEMIEQVSTEIEQSGVNGRVELYEVHIMVLPSGSRKDLRQRGC